ncbi:CPK14 [Symbiodinium natans]|uniref:CPK14 protein n=1 Tax=Symbiodinium natans TaxID=878477 RepID=A0A812SJN5_9DINO|nr:CPK14 [Symbiodinium natans]
MAALHCERRRLSPCHKCPRNGDGHISKDNGVATITTEELLEAVQGKGVTMDEVSQALDGIDCDHDGEINYAEFVKMLR